MTHYLDRRFRQVGRIKKATGTDHKPHDQGSRRYAIGPIRAWPLGHLAEHPERRVHAAPGVGVLPVRRAPQTAYSGHRPDTYEVKIGVSNNLAKRLKMLQNANGGELFLLGTMAGGIEQECWLHQKWAHCHKRGEWFHATTELLLWASSLESHARLSAVSGVGDTTGVISGTRKEQEQP